MSLKHCNDRYSRLSVLLLLLTISQICAFSLDPFAVQSKPLRKQHSASQQDLTAAFNAATTSRNKPSMTTQLSAANSMSGGGTGEPSLLQKVSIFANKQFFLLGMFVAVGLAKALPALGKNGGILRPELFIGRFGVTFIFLLSGLSLEISELKEAFANVKLNAAIQLVIFGAWPFLVGVPLTGALRQFAPRLLPSALLDGLLILTCLPTTVNMCIILTSAAGGNVASSLCNAVISNLAGIFVTPALLLRFFGTNIQLAFGPMVVKLCSKVLLPVSKYFCADHPTTRS